MEAKEIMRIDALIYEKEEFKKAQKQGGIFGKYKSIEAFDYHLFMKSEYKDMIKSLESNQVLVICKARINGRPQFQYQWIIDVIAGYYNVDSDYFKQKTRKQPIVKRRQILHYILWKCSQKQIIDNMSLEWIGEITNTHYSTVLYSIGQVRGFYETYKDYRSEVDAILSLLKINEYVKID